MNILDSKWFCPTVFITCIVIICGILLFDSDKYVTETSPIKTVEREYIGKQLSQEINCTYEDGLLRLKYKINGIDNRLLNRHFSGWNNPTIATLSFVNKDGFVILEEEIERNDINPTNNGTEYTAYKVIRIDKGSFKEISKINTTYNKYLDLTLEEYYDMKRESLRNIFAENNMTKCKSYTEPCILK